MESVIQLALVCGTHMPETEHAAGAKRFSLLLSWFIMLAIALQVKVSCFNWVFTM